MPDPLLSMRGISKAFPGVQALSEANLTLYRGEVHALMGENGAGKSTLIKTLTGVHQRDAGEVLFEGKPIKPAAPLEAEGLGISTVFQEVNLIPHLSVAENISLGRQRSRFGFMQWKEIRERAERALKRFDVEIDVTQEVCSYSVAIQQMVAIARAVDIDAKLLVLDEPTSSLDENEVEELFAVMRKLCAQGMGIVFITHFLDQVYSITDRITVLRNGQSIGEYETAKLPRIELISHMLGKPVDQLADTGSDGLSRSEAASQGEAWLEAKDLSKEGVMSSFDFEIRKGEAAGLAGLLGSGRTETAKLLFGILKSDTGETSMAGNSVGNPKSPRQAIARKIGFCSEDRKREGIIPNLSVRENIVLALQARKGFINTISRQEQNRIADKFIKRLRIKTPSRETPIRTLSGGNQQKALLARWLATDPDLIILDEPTRGIDIGARDEIEELIRELQKEGMAVLLISSELEEIERLCERVWVLRDRQFVGELSDEEISEKAIMSLIAHSDEMEGSDEAES
ncbi:sugar ABC transporter ATP-binding protein [Pelagicoccus mobilis]|uniref:Sugar ABC transporter ATP-binding protein n=1 Tax=Pelagicoccus mobilis TaxID=415221 RepID=A0A934RY91_9BACT|nr:sugar ABC transporter ATP-binding protein [Pelagicoccus mobilis]MBK1878957.1 sugar ABC transporter ATP-binding protein [Pelagicoccus mobilis]